MRKLIAFAICTAIVFQFGFASCLREADAASVVAKRIALVKKEYPNKSKLNTYIDINGYSGGGCNAMVMYTTLRVFHNCYVPGCNTFKKVGKTSTSNTAAMKKLFKKAKIGDVVRFSKNGKDAHFTIYLSSNSSGANFYEANVGGKNVVRYNNHWPWYAMKKWPTGGATTVEVFRAKNYSKVNKKKSAKLYKKGAQIEVEGAVYKVTKVYGFGGNVKLIGFKEGGYYKGFKKPKYVFTDNFTENNLNLNGATASGSNKKDGMDYAMVYKVTAVAKNAYTNIIGDKSNKDSNDNNSTTENDVANKDISKFNSSDVENLKRIIAEQCSNGATVSEDLTSDEYTWDEDGRIYQIKWNNKSMSGDLSLKGLPTLKSFYCGNYTFMLGNGGTTGFDAATFNHLSSLDVSSNDELLYLYCGDNSLKTIDVSNNTKLKKLDCNSNMISSIDLSNNINLDYLDCSYNEDMGSLELNNNPLLKKIKCSENCMTSLNVINCKALEYLECDENELSELNLMNNTKLTYLNCEGNYIKTLDLTNCIALSDLTCDYGVDVIGYGD